MSNIYFTSDSHFYHSNVLDFEKHRTYECIENMNQDLIKKWNSVVKKNDKVFHLGDFNFGGYSKWEEILNQLRGNIHLIAGNHDRPKIYNRALKEGFLQEVSEVGHYMKVGKYHLNLTHYPLEIGNRSRLFNLHGHLHSNPSNMLNQINLGVDSQIPLVKDRPFGQPVHIDELVEYLDEINPKIEELFLKERGLN